MVEETVEQTQETTQTESTEQMDQTQETTEQSTNETETGDSLLGKKGEETTEEVVVPEKYEFTMPEGRELDAEMVEKVTPLFKELKVSQEGAQKLADLLVSDQEAKEAKYKEITEGWKQETIKSLGSGHEEKLSVAAKFIDKFGNDNVRQVLNDTGLGNHPEVVQMFIKAGKHFSDDPLATGTTRTNTVSDPEKSARKMFPNTKY